MAETWMRVCGYEDNYKVSDLGRVRRIAPGQGATVGRILAQAMQGDYLAVTLYKNDQKFKIGVHILVAEAFHGKRPAGMVTNHKDTDKLNNRADNLEWLTGLENTRHALANGLHGGKPMPGESNPRAKLTEQQVTEIRILKGTVGARVLAKRFGVSRSAIQFIHQGKHWKQPAEWPADLRVREFPEVAR